MIELPLQIAGEELWLHSERALWWPAGAVLLIADVHLGKAQVLRHAGMAVPTGQTMADLRRLDGLIDRYRPQRLIVLGDLVHGRAGERTPWVADVRAWRERHAALSMELVEGNHDRHFAAGRLGFACVQAPFPLGPFGLCHEPARFADGYALAGHVHPGVSVRDGWRRHRLPAFRFGAQCGLLPAFGALTGLHEPVTEAGEHIVAVTPAGLLRVTPRASPVEGLG